MWTTKSPVEELKHLRVHTPEGYLIHHPLIQHKRQPAPGETPAKALVTCPTGYINTSTLARQYHLSTRATRRILATKLSALWVRGQPLQKTWPEKKAHRILTKHTAAYTAPITPPPGYITAAQAIKILGISRSTLNTYDRTHKLTPIIGRQKGSSAPSHFYHHQSVLELRKKRIQELHNLQKKLLT